MVSPALHIPFLETIADFFRSYGIGSPLNPEVMCMRLEDQPDAKVATTPLYRINFFRITHLYESTLEFASGDNQVPVPQSYLQFSFPGRLETWNLKGRLYGYAIYFTPTFAGLDITNPQFDEMYPFFSQEAQPTLLLNQGDAELLKALSDELIEETYSGHADKWTMVHKLLHVYLAKIRRLYVHTVDTPLPVTTRANQTLFYRFRTELDTYFQDLTTQKARSMPSVSIIAKRLHINANYLNSTIKRITGRTASSYIQDKIMLEAKAHLLHSDLQIAEVAYILGFEHVSYFNRFFKKHTHYAPVEFRHKPNG